MLPTRDQIELAAYDRWIRRHRAHGHDRHDWIGAETELTYLLNYRTITVSALDSPRGAIEAGKTVCRFCERTPKRATFSMPRLVVQGLAGTSLASAQICDECQEDCRDPLASHSEGFWRMVQAGGDGGPNARGRNFDAVAAFKSLVASALLMMPDDELAYFGDTLEWVNNPDHEYDAGLFADTFCQVYHLQLSTPQPSITLARRIDDDVPFPYMVAFLSWGDVVVQTALPMCLCDQDLDGRCEQMPRRSLVAGEGPHFHEARTTVLRLRAERRPRARVFA